MGSHVIDDGNRTQSDLCKLEFIYKANDGWGCFARGMKALNLRDAHSGFSYMFPCTWDTFANNLASRLLGIHSDQTTITRSPRLVRWAQAEQHKPLKMWKDQKTMHKLSKTIQVKVVRDQQWCWSALRKLRWIRGSIETRPNGGVAHVDQRPSIALPLIPHVAVGLSTWVGAWALLTCE